MRNEAHEIDHAPFLLAISLVCGAALGDPWPGGRDPVLGAKRIRQRARSGTAGRPQDPVRDLVLLLGERRPQRPVQTDREGLPAVRWQRWLAFHQSRRRAVPLYQQGRQRQSRWRLGVPFRRQPHGVLCHHSTGRAPPDAGRKSAAGVAHRRSATLRRRTIPMGAFSLSQLSRTGSRLRDDPPSARPLFHELPRRLRRAPRKSASSNSIRR